MCTRAELLASHYGSLIVPREPSELKSPSVFNSDVSRRSAVTPWIRSISEDFSDLELKRLRTRRIFDGYGELPKNLVQPVDTVVT